MRSRHLVPLLCVSSLICLWGDGHRSSSDGLNILFTSTLLKTHQCVSYTYAPRLHVRWHALPPLRVMLLWICILCICMSRWKWKHTHPSLSISSVLKVNTWKWSVEYSREFKALVHKQQSSNTTNTNTWFWLKNTAFNFYLSVEVSSSKHA